MSTIPKITIIGDSPTIALNGNLNGQSFTPSENFDLAAVTVKLCFNSEFEYQTPTIASGKKIYAMLYNMSEGIPVGSPIVTASADMIAGAHARGGQEQITINFSIPPSLVSDTKYSVVFNIDDGTVQVGDISLMGNSSNPYDGGRLEAYSGDTWGKDPSQDLIDMDIIISAPGSPSNPTVIEDPATITGTDTVYGDGTATGVTLNADVTVPASTALTLDIPSLAELKGSGKIVVAPGGKIKLKDRPEKTVAAGTRYVLAGKP